MFTAIDKYLLWLYKLDLYDCRMISNILYTDHITNCCERECNTTDMLSVVLLWNLLFILLPFNERRIIIVIFVEIKTTLPLGDWILNFVLFFFYHRTSFWKFVMFVNKVSKNITSQKCFNDLIRIFLVNYCYHEVLSYYPFQDTVKLNSLQFWWYNSSNWFIRMSILITGQQFHDVLVLSCWIQNPIKEWWSRFYFKLISWHQPTIFAVVVIH